MSYHINQIKLVDFVTDASIKKPRFQRKSTWGDKTKFELALSIFRQYPCGATIIWKQTSPDGTTTKWLLDGRQRREALQAIYNDPNEVVRWAKSYLGHMSEYTSTTISQRFWTKVKEYVDAEVTDQVDQSSQDFQESGEDDEESDEDITPNDSNNGQLQVLLDLIIIGITESTRKQGTNSGITSLFDFKQYLTENKALNNALYSLVDTRKVDSKKLWKFLRGYYSSHSTGNQYDDFEVFFNFIDSNFDFKEPDGKLEFRSVVSQNWDSRQKKVIDSLVKLDSLFSNLELAGIETEDMHASDAEKIFNLINNSGTKLTSSEILSAKPKWNKALSQPPSDELKNAINRVYNDLSVERSGDQFVRWDAIASTTYYLEEPGSDNNKGIDLFFSFDIGNSGKITSAIIAKRITTGFQIFSTLYQGCVKKEDLERVADTLKWDNLEHYFMELKTFFALFDSFPYLKTLHSWGKTLSDVISQLPTLCFLGMCFKKWKAMGQPNGVDNQDLRRYRKNVYILLDTVIFEYASNLWKGSGDVKLKTKIAQLPYDNSILTPVAKENWKQYLNEFFEKGTFMNSPVADSNRNSVIFLYNIIKNLNGEGYMDKSEIDHIIPQSEFESSAMSNKDVIKNNIYNLALLPHSINEAKKNKSLAELKAAGSSFIQELIKFEEVPEDQFDNCSSPDKYEHLKKIRSVLYNDAFDSKRDAILNGH